MLNPFKDVDWHPDRSRRRSFALSLIVGFPCVGLLLLIVGYLRGLGWNVDAALGVGGGGMLAGLVFLALPSIVKPFYVTWYFLACCIGFVVGNVLMALVYYIVVTGTGLVRRAGRPSRRWTLDRSAKTYWNSAGPAPEPRQYYRQF
jgi:hypothetical protein